MKKLFLTSVWLLSASVSANTEDDYNNVVNRINILKQQIAYREDLEEEYERLKSVVDQSSGQISYLVDSQIKLRSVLEQLKKSINFHQDILEKLKEKLNFDDILEKKVTEFFGLRNVEDLQSFIQDENFRREKMDDLKVIFANKFKELSDQGVFNGQVYLNADDFLYIFNMSQKINTGLINDALNKKNIKDSSDLFRPAKM